MTTTTSAQEAAAVSVPYPPLPASPTLTNPDMILPYENRSYDDYDAADVARYANGPPSPPNLWKDAQQPGMAFSYGLPLHAAVGQITPTVPIVYHHGTLLSDIGEVTEVESTAGAETETETDPKGRDGAPAPKNGNVMSSPTFGYQRVTPRAKNGTHQRNSSSESGSTVVSRDGRPAPAFPDLDDSTSVDDPNFHGDDEDSVVDDSFAYRPRLRATRSAILDVGTDAESELGDDEFTSLALSKRAEMILANAKQRLNSMEGNLSRARSSLFITPSAAMSPVHSSSSKSNSPASTKARIAPQLGYTPSRHREAPASKALYGSPSHARVLSENAVSGSLYSSPLAAKSSDRLPVMVELDANRSPDVPDALDATREESRGRSTYDASKYNQLLGPLTEFEALEYDPAKASGRSSVTSFTSGSTEHRTLSRSSSSLQMRGIKDQMEDLKGRISSLRDRAREESMRRRSLQSLRSPSPYTAAEQWYTGASAVKDAFSSADAGNGHVPWNKHGRIVQDDETTGPETLRNEDTQDANDLHDPVISQPRQSVSDSTPAEPVFVNHLPRAASPDSEGSQSVDGYDTATENGDVMDDLLEHSQNDAGFEDYDVQSESGASLYHDSMQHMISHEDREDAFDYEHFFLHSAMGTIGGRRDSISSEDSVETTKGPIATSSLQRMSIGHTRGISTDTLSTVATFQTAYEDTEEHTDMAIPRATERSDTAMTARKTAPDATNDSSSSDARSSSDESSQPPSPSGDLLSRDLRTGHRPSVSSFNSAGTARSFPLVNKPKLKSEIKTFTPEPRVTGPLLASTPSPLEVPSDAALTKQPRVDALPHDDKVLVEQLMGSLQTCVGIIEESSRSGYDARIFRRRLDAARRILDGHEALV